MCTVSDSIKRSWNEIIYFRSFGTLVWISRICNDSFSRQSFVSSQWRKNFAALRTKGWSDVLLMIILLFIVPVSNAKLERMFSKLKRVKINFRCSLSTFQKILLKIMEEGSSQETFNPMSAITKQAIDKVRRATEEKGSRGFKSRNSAKVNVKSLSDDDS